MSMIAGKIVIQYTERQIQRCQARTNETGYHNFAA